MGLTQAVSLVITGLLALIGSAIWLGTICFADSPLIRGWYYLKYSAFLIPALCFIALLLKKFKHPWIFFLIALIALTIPLLSPEQRFGYEGPGDAIAVVVLLVATIISLFCDQQDNERTGRQNGQDEKGS